jgi:hypothetical protein
VTIYQSLLASLAVVILLLGGATIALTFIGSKQTAETLAAVLLDKTVSQVELNLRQFFEPATGVLELVRGWDSAGLLDPDDAAATNRLLAPILRADRQLSALMVADERGRFVTAWVGELDARAGTLRSFSCGQGPLLYYRAAARTCEPIETDTVPLGCLDDLTVVPREPIRMQPGDIFMALLDGFINAESARRERFGTSRVIDLIRQGSESSAQELVATLRQAVTAFTDGARPDDDRTVVVIKAR